MVKMGRAIDDDSPAEDLHELRKVGKELRYLLEFFASLYPADVVKPFIKTLKGLQDQLGRFQDREVQATALRNLAPDVANPPTVMAMGVLVDRFIKEEAQARTEFADRFAGLRLQGAARAREGALRVSTVLATYNIKGGVGQDLGGGQPRDARGPRAALRRCCGTSTRRARAPTCSASARRSRAAATSSCAASPTSTR